MCYGFLESRELHHNHNTDTKNITLWTIHS